MKTFAGRRPVFLLLLAAAAAALLLGHIMSTPDDDIDSSISDDTGKQHAEEDILNRYPPPRSHLPNGNTAQEVDHGPKSGLPPNEMGSVMVLMYHHLGEEEGQWRRSYDNFWADLEYLYENGYRPVSLASYLSGNIDLPRGMSPVVLTFDDGLSSQLSWVDGIVGKPDPQTAVGMLLEFAEKHPGFEPRGVFYLNSPRPFHPMPGDQIAETLNWMVEKGFELGNHTHWHANLRELPDGEVQKVIAATEKMITDAVPGYEVQSLSLPFGLWPQQPDLAVRGSHGQISYDHDAVMLVGARPASSPFSEHFAPRNMPRIQASSAVLTRWFEEMEQNPDRRYVSDGNTQTVTVPAGKEDEVCSESVDNRTLRIVGPDVSLDETADVSDYILYTRVP